MSTKYPGGLITKTPVTPAGPYQTGAAPGVWTVEQALQYTKQGIWPTAGLTPNYIEDVFSTYLYTGTGAAQTITNGIDLSTYGGLVWTKARDTTSTSDNTLNYNSSGAYVTSNNRSASGNSGNSWNTTGFNVGPYLIANTSGINYASWTFRKQPKFFDVVTYTGTGSARTIAHSLASTPGCIIVKRTDTTADWQVYHVGFGSATVSAQLNLFAAPAAASTVWNSTAPTSTVFSVGTSTDVNASGGTYVAYLFANNAGGFGLTGTDNVITCGTVTGAGSTTYVPLTLGYEPQWILTKKVSGGTSGWSLFDVMRGWVSTINLNGALLANTSDPTDPGQWQPGSPSATGINFLGDSGIDYAYIAIRRGPMKTPTDATTVLGITTSAGTSPAYVSSFPADVALRKQITGGDPTLQARLTGATKIFTDFSSSEGADSNVTWDYQNGMFTSTGANANQYGWLMRRAPGFLDVVCYTGTGPSYPATQAVNHNLGVAPELTITKRRATSSADWAVDFPANATYRNLMLNNTNAGVDNGWFGTPSSTQIQVSGVGATGASGSTYIAYLFATVAGVSKVGSYAGTGATQTINCGFTGGARFVVIKRIDDAGSWYVWDTTRGMVSGTDPSFHLEDATAQVNVNACYTIATGFQLVSSGSQINASGGTYLYLAIA